MKHSHWLILYDICDPGRLKKVEKIVSQYGVRVQKSVFESDAYEETILILQQRLKKVIKGNDFIATIPLCEKDWQKAEKHGIMIPNNYINEAFGIL